MPSRKLQDRRWLSPVTLPQYRIIRRAVDGVRRSEGQPRMAVGRALELICADFLSGLPAEVR